MHLIARFDKLVDCGNAIGNCRGSHIDQLRLGGGHEAKANPRLALRVVVEQVTVDPLGGKSSFGMGQIAKEGDQSLTLSQIAASTEQSLFSPISYTQWCGLT